MATGQQATPVYLGLKTSAAAEVRPTFVILTITLSPGFVLLTRITKPITLATPTPCFPICSMVTMYSSPTLIGVVGAFDPQKRLFLYSYFS